MIVACNIIENCVFYCGNISHIVLELPKLVTYKFMRKILDFAEGYYWD